MKLIVGCARSGTAYCAEGWGLGHEKLNENGISSWLLAARHCEGFKLPSVHGAVPEDWQPSEVVHVVRYPLHQIASATVMRHGWLAWAQQYVDIGYPVAGEVAREAFNYPVMCAEKGEHLRVLMRYWLEWNEVCHHPVSVGVERDEYGQTVGTVGWGPMSLRVEDLDFPEVPKNVNARNHVRLEWWELEAADEELAEQVVDRARIYGYSVDDVLERDSR
jgi:hypothetical protein